MDVALDVTKDVDAEARDAAAAISVLQKENRPTSEIDEFVSGISSNAIEILLRDSNFFLTINKSFVRRKKYDEAIANLKAADFGPKKDLVEFWDEIHYELKERQIGRTLTPLLRYRVRQKHPPPGNLAPYSGPRRPTASLPRQGKSVLQSWYNNHLDRPYPDREEKEQLCQESGLTLKQIHAWFSKARRKGRRFAEEKAKEAEKQINLLQAVVRLISQSESDLSTDEDRLVIDEGDLVPTFTEYKVPQEEVSTDSTMSSSNQQHQDGTSQPLTQGLSQPPPQAAPLYSANIGDDMFYTQGHPGQGHSSPFPEVGYTGYPGFQVQMPSNEGQSPLQGGGDYVTNLTPESTGNYVTDSTYVTTQAPGVRANYATDTTYATTPTPGGSANNVTDTTYGAYQLVGGGDSLPGNDGIPQYGDWQAGYFSNQQPQYGTIQNYGYQATPPCAGYYGNQVTAYTGSYGNQTPACPSYYGYQSPQYNGSYGNHPQHPCVSPSARQPGSVWNQPYSGQTVPLTSPSTSRNSSLVYYITNPQLYLEQGMQQSYPQSRGENRGEDPQSRVSPPVQQWNPEYTHQNSSLPVGSLRSDNFRPSRSMSDTKQELRQTSPDVKTPGFIPITENDFYIQPEIRTSCGPVTSQITSPVSSSGGRTPGCPRKITKDPDVTAAARDLSKIYVTENYCSHSNYGNYDNRDDFSNHNNYGDRSNFGNRGARRITSRRDDDVHDDVYPVRGRVAPPLGNRIIHHPILGDLDKLELLRKYQQAHQPPVGTPRGGTKGGTAGGGKGTPRKAEEAPIGTPRDCTPIGTPRECAPIGTPRECAPIRTPHGGDRRMSRYRPILPAPTPGCYTTQPCARPGIPPAPRGYTPPTPGYSPGYAPGYRQQEADTVILGPLIPLTVSELDITPPHIPYSRAEIEAKGGIRRISTEKETEAIEGLLHLSEG